jgi:hypothetical protein
MDDELQLHDISGIIITVTVQYRPLEKRGWWYRLRMWIREILRMGKNEDTD